MSRSVYYKQTVMITFFLYLIGNDLELKWHTFYVLNYDIFYQTVLGEEIQGFMCCLLFLLLSDVSYFHLVFPGQSERLDFFFDVSFFNWFSLPHLMGWIHHP